MNKVKHVFGIAMSLVLAASVGLTAVGCGDNDEGGNYDPETRPLVLSTNAPDKVFSPFFSTSTVDANILAMTQIGLVSTDKNGNIVCGEDQPSAALDYSVTENKSGNTTVTTTYQFVIKNGVKFSDGEDLTIKDVLFNLYVYLDPVYTGSATMYSTKIVGLNEYRTQDPNATDDTAAQNELLFQTEAQRRIDALVDYVKAKGILSAAETKPNISGWTEEKLAQAQKDFETVGAAFKEELESDYNDITSSMATFKETNGFTEAWQVFLVNDAGITELYKKNQDNTYLKVDGNYQFDPDGSETQYYQDLLDEFIDEYEFTTNDTSSDEYKVQYEEAVKQWAVQFAYATYIAEEVEDTFAADFEIVVRYWGTASTILNQFTAEAKSEYFLNIDPNERIKSISGITAVKGGAFTPSSVSNSKSSYSNDYDVLQIVINGVDPKAIYNFGFSVAPLHYYSGTYNGTDYVKTFDGVTNFGLPTGDINFMNTVLKDSKKNGFPVGAGVYQATNSDGYNGKPYLTDEEKAAGMKELTLSDFMSNNVIYFKRNENFQTVGSGLNNAKIRLLRYQVINSDAIIESLNAGDIDFGEPDATQENLGRLGTDIKGVTAWTNGYGYVGINARFVPSILVRRAIIKALDTSYITNDYYKGGMAEIIYRSMSTTSWAYPDDASIYVSKDSYRTRYEYDPDGIQELLDLLKLPENGGYTLKDGIYTNGKDTLNYTFTIAGGSTQHPAYSMFINAMNVLNQCTGINVKVVTSQTALTDLTAGKLQIWAAAWTATIDPDMYQVYHKDSTASSILNWGYDYIMADANTYGYEQTIVKNLSTVIDEARATTDQDERADMYRDALDYVMELAVEFPTYQRKDLFAYNTKYIDESTLQSGTNLTPYNGPLSRIWEVNFR